MNKAVQDIVGEHTIAGRRVLIERTTWKGSPTLSYDVLDASTLRCLTDESFGNYPTDKQIKAVLGDPGRADEDVTGSAPGNYRFPDEESCRRSNRAATFSPMTEDGARQCVEVAGIQLYGYLDHHTGAVRVSIDLDTVAPALARPNGTVPLLVECGHTVLFADTERPITAVEPDDESR